MRPGTLSAAVVVAVAAATLTPGQAPSRPPEAQQAPQPLRAEPVAARSCSSTPFRADPSKHQWFRIPSVIRTNSGALVAFAEKRDRRDGDDGNFDTVTARSTDGGCSWGAWKRIGNDGRNRVSNPVPVYDADTGKLFLFSVVKPYSGSGGSGKGLYLQTSTDDGRSFSSLLARNIKPVGSKGGLVGPGHGIQLRKTHSGRMIVARGYQKNGKYGAYSLVSDDHGATWEIGYDWQDPTGDVDTIEGSIAERDDGSLFITYRLRIDRAPAGTARRYAISTRGGGSGSTNNDSGLATSMRKLPLRIVSVQAPVLQLTGTYHNLLLLSAPADPTAHLRRDMTIFVSRTGGETWSRRYPVELESKPGSYSDLVQVDDRTVGILYETGNRKWKERIAFRRIPIAQLSDPTKVAAKVTARHRDTITTSRRLVVPTKTTVAGISSPPGRVTVKLSNAKRTVRARATLTYTNRGGRYLTLPRVPRGRYKVTVIYSGTLRIKRTVLDAGYVRVTP